MPGERNYEAQELGWLAKRLIQNKHDEKGYHIIVFSTKLVLKMNFNKDIEMLHWK
jgi:hypothetical protein